MAKFVLKDASVVVNSVDISNHVRSVTISTSRPQVDVTSMGDVNQTMVPGIGTATMTFEVFQDFAASSIDSQMSALSTSNSGVSIVVKPTSSAVGSTNPTYTMTGILYDYNPLDGGVGDAASTTLTFVNSSQTGLVRATS